MVERHTDYFLTVRFRRDHEKTAYAFYSVDSQEVAEHLLELFRKEVAKDSERVIEVVEAATLDMDQRVIFRQTLGELENLKWAHPADARRALDPLTPLLPYLEQAAKWEPLIRDELGLAAGPGETAPPASVTPPAAPEQIPEADTGAAEPTRQQVLEAKVAAEWKQQRENPPAWLRSIIRGVDALWKQPGTDRERWLGYVREVAGAEKDRIGSLLAPGDPLTPAEKCFALTALHDYYREAERMESVLPPAWRGCVDPKSEEFKTVQLLHRCCSQSATEGLLRPDMEHRLRGYIDDLTRDVAEAAAKPESDPKTVAAQATATIPPGTEVPEILRGAHAICGVLKQPKNQWRSISALNKRDEGPINYKGNRPWVPRPKLIAWWAHIHEMAEAVGEKAQTEIDREATADAINEKLRRDPKYAQLAAQDHDLGLDNRRTHLRRERREQKP